jgi:hypothetical protein
MEQSDVGMSIIPDAVSPSEAYVPDQHYKPRRLPETPEELPEPQTHKGRSTVLILASLAAGAAITVGVTRGFEAASNANLPSGTPPGSAGTELSKTKSPDVMTSPTVGPSPTETPSVSTSSTPTAAPSESAHPSASASATLLPNLLPANQYRAFSSSDYARIAEHVPVLSKPQPLNKLSPITDNAKADTQIRTMAMDVGYGVRPFGRQDQLVNVEQDPTKPAVFVEPILEAPLKALLKEVRAESIPVTLKNGYRTVQEQKLRFDKDLAEAHIGSAAIAKGDKKALSDLRKLLVSGEAPPDFSIRSTGAAVEILCDNKPMTATDVCSTALAKGNQNLPEQFGFVPLNYFASHLPKQVSGTYIYVGKTELKNASLGKID